MIALLESWCKARQRRSYEHDAHLNSHGPFVDGYGVGTNRSTRYLVALLAATIGCVPVAAQTADEVPPEFSQTLYELVERFELARDLLRKQTELNAQLLTQQEVDALVAAAHEENRALRAEIKRLRATAKHEAQRAERFKREAVKFQLDSDDRARRVEATLDTIEDERLLQFGPVFYLRGSLGAFGILNIPSSPVGFYGQFDYHLQTQRSTFGFGLSFAILPQRKLVAFWHRLFPPRSR